MWVVVLGVASAWSFRAVESLARPVAHRPLGTLRPSATGLFSELGKGVSWYLALRAMLDFDSLLGMVL